MTAIEISNKRITFSKTLSELEVAENLTSLKLEQVTFFGTEQDMRRFSSFLRGHPTLETIHFQQVKVGNTSFDLTLIVSQILISVRSLKDFTLDGCDFKPAALICLAYRPSLVNLALRNCNLSDVDAEILAKSIPAGSLESIDLTGNNMSDLGRHAFSTIIKNNNVLVNSISFGARIKCTDGLEAKKASAIAA
jgi:hypothetical protein